MSDLDAPGVPDGAEDRLLVVPANPANLDVVVPTERAGSSRGDPTVHEDQLEPAGDALPVQVLQNQRAGPVLVGGGRHDQRAHRKASHVDGHDALGALGTAVGAAVVEGEPAVRGTAGQVGVR